MLLKDIQQHPHLGTVMHIFQLVGGKLIHHDALWLDLLHHIETGDADVARQEGVMARLFQQMIDQGGGLE